MKTLRSLTIILAIAVATSVASANSVSFYASMPTTLTDFGPVAMNVNQFDSSLGTLTKVILTLNGAGTTDFEITSNDPNQIPTVLKQLDPYVHLNLTGTGITGTAFDPMSITDPGVGYPPGVTVAYLATYDTTPLAMYDYGYTKNITTGLSPFIGNGTLTYDLSTTTGLLSDITGGNYTTGQTTYANANFEITYDYEPPPSGTPEPGTLSLFGTGLLGLAGMLRHKFAKSR